MTWLWSPSRVAAGLPSSRRPLTLLAPTPRRGCHQTAEVARVVGHAYGEAAISTPERTPLARMPGAAGWPGAQPYGDTIVVR